MPWWLLLLFLFFVWCLGVASEVGRVAVENLRRPLPNGTRRGVAVLPIIPLFPLLFWGAAMLIELVVDPWGRIVVGAIHALLAVVFAVSIARNWWRLRASD